MRGKIGIHGVIPIALLQDKILNQSCLRVYAALSSFQGLKDNCWPSRKDIMERGGLTSLSQVTKALTILEEQGWVIKNQRGHNRTNVYSILFEIEIINSGSTKNDTPEVLKSSLSGSTKNDTPEVLKSDTSINIKEQCKITLENNNENNTLFSNENRDPKTIPSLPETNQDNITRLDIEKEFKKYIKTRCSEVYKGSWDFKKEGVGAIGIYKKLPLRTTDYGLLTTNSQLPP